MVCCCDGCLLGSRLLHTNVSCPHFLLGLNQHVALNSNAAFRRKLLQIAALMKTLTIASFSYWRHDSFSPSLSLSLSLSLQTLWLCPPHTPVLCILFLFCSLSFFAPSFPPSPLRPPPSSFTRCSNVPSLFKHEYLFQPFCCPFSQYTGARHNQCIA